MRLYFDSIKPIFQRLQKLKVEKTLWKNVPNKQSNIYVPILDAFRNEILRINQENDNIPSLLIQYLLGNQDFYKVIKTKKRVEILGLNLNNSLNLNTLNRPKRDVPKLKLPTQIIQFDYKPLSSTTLLLVCNEGWQISFRIHNAESLVIPSLKFDINLIAHPQTLYSHHITY